MRTGSAIAWTLQPVPQGTFAAGFRLNFRREPNGESKTKTSPRHPTSPSVSAPRPAASRRSPHFFAHLPPDSGMAFVLVQHLSPDHESMLTRMLARAAPIPVVEAKHGMRLEARPGVCHPARRDA